MLIDANRSLPNLLHLNLHPGGGPFMLANPALVAQPIAALSY
jgi:hypothetical protein